MRKQITFCVILLLVLTQVAFAQTTVPLAGACTDCAAVITAFNNCSVASAGTLKAGTMVDTGVTQTIQLTVGKVGKYSLSTTNNGVTFAASGTFTALGLQTVVLTASGYTVSGGTTTFTLSSKSQSCTFDRAVGGPTTVITGPCPSNLKFWKTDGVNNRYALSKDSVLYAMPYVVYGKNNISGATNGSYRPETMIISPTRVQNVPKMVAIAGGFSVGIDGYIYFVTQEYSFNMPVDSRNAPSYLTYPYSTIGTVSPYDMSMLVSKYPLPPTGTKWVDIAAAAPYGQPNGEAIFALNDLGEAFILRAGPWETSMGLSPTVKLAVPLGTNPATFKYTKFQKAAAVPNLVLMGNDGNYYSMATFGGRLTYTYGWGPDEYTAPDSDLGTATAKKSSVSSEIRKMPYPAGTVLAEGSDAFTVDGKIFSYGTIAEVITGIWGSAPITAQSRVYFYYPLKDGNYSYNRPDIRIRDNHYWDCSTPRELALPAGATKFTSAYITHGIASIAEGVTLGTGLGSKALIALTDNGSYGLHPQKINNYWPENQLANMELAGVTTAGGANIYYPKYVPSLPSFAPYHIPQNSYGLGLDGTYYTKVTTSNSDWGGVVPSPIGRYQEYVLNGGVPSGSTGSFYDLSDKPPVLIYSTLLNGNCDANNPYPEP